jgi:hypothetical protein
MFKSTPKDECGIEGHQTFRSIVCLVPLIRSCMAKLFLQHMTSKDFALMGPLTPFFTALFMQDTRSTLGIR